MLVRALIAALALWVLFPHAAAASEPPAVPAITPVQPVKQTPAVDDKTDLPSKPSIVEVLSITREIDDADANQIADRVKKINENPRIKAVLLELDSPGGGVLPSQHIYEELSKIKVPVVAWCDSECASGAMYVAMAPSVKYIAVREGAISGSIGVIMRMMRYDRLLDWAKVDAQTFKSGALKDAGAPTHAATQEEKDYLQGIVAELANRFYGLVAKARGDKIKDWDRIKRAEIFFGHDGVDAGLVDEVMTRDQAIKKAKALSGAATIYTREEMKDMAKAADSSTDESAPSIKPTFGGSLSKYLGELDDLMQGQRVVVEYRCPIRF